MTQPIVAALRMNDAFEAVWPLLASATGAELRSAASVTELAPFGGVEAVLVACGGAEEEAFAPIAELGAATRLPVVVAGANADHLIAIALVRAGAGDYFALPGDQERLRAWFEQ